MKMAVYTIKLMIEAAGAKNLSNTPFVLVLYAIEAKIICMRLMTYDANVVTKIIHHILVMFILFS